MKQRDQIFEQYFFDRTYVNQPHDLTPFQKSTLQSSSNHNQLTWYLNQKTRALCYQVIGPPALIASCAWLADYIHQHHPEKISTHIQVAGCQQLGLDGTESHYFSFACLAIEPLLKPVVMST